MFKVVVYYGDSDLSTRSTFSRKSQKKSATPLTRRMPLLDPVRNKWTFLTLILSTPGTFVRRHGPAAQAEWRVTKGDFTHEAAHGPELYLRGEHKWAGYLRDKFDRVVVDECDRLKNPDSLFNHSVWWLQAKQ